MQLSDELLERSLKVITPFVLSELEEVVEFEGKSDNEREDIMKASIKSLEVSTILLSKFFNENSLDEERLLKVFSLIEDGKIGEAADLINDF